MTAPDRPLTLMRPDRKVVAVLDNQQFEECYHLVGIGEPVGRRWARPSELEDWIPLMQAQDAMALLRRAGRRTTVCLCGSMRFESEMREAAREESVAGRLVLMPLCNMKEPHPLWANAADAERIKVELDALHKAKIDAADEVVIVAPGGYIGDSTRSEIAYAEAHGKPVRYWNGLNTLSA